MSSKDKLNKDSLTRHTFRYTERLHSQKDFKQVLSLGRRLVHPAIFIYIVKRKDLKPLTRMGLITSGKLGIAAMRNRVKRRLRELFRLNKNKMMPGIDMVFVPKLPVMKLNFEQLETVVLNLLKNSGVLSFKQDLKI